MQTSVLRGNETREQSGENFLTDLQLERNHLFSCCFVEVILKTADAQNRFAELEKR